MTKDKLIDDDLMMLKKANGNICVSVIVPVHRVPCERRSDKILIEKALDRAKELLHHKYPDQQIKPLLTSMDELFQRINFLHTEDGIGLYISSDVEHFVQFPFTVEEKVTVGDQFEMRDLLYKENYGIPYLVLLLTKQGSRLFQGRWNTLTEIADNSFPMKNEDDYEYAKPSRGSSYAGYSHDKNFEKDKSELEAIRYKDFLRKMDKPLGNYLVKDMSLIVMGVEKELSLFCSVSNYSKNIIAKISGSYNYDTKKQLADIAWPAIRTHRENEWKKLVTEFEEKVGEGLGVTGIVETWRAAREGRSFKLLVEKDYRMPGFLTDNEYHLYLQPPDKEHNLVPDAVDEIIAMVLAKNGHVIFVDSGILTSYHQIALITRY